MERRGRGQEWGRGEKRRMKREGERWGKNVWNAEKEYQKIY